MTPFTPDTEGTFFGLNETEYRSAPGIANSDLKHAHRSMAHYLAAKNAPKKESTPSQVFGTLLHLAALEPLRLNSAFVVKPEGMNYKSNAGKDMRDSQTEAINTAKERDALMGCRASVLAHPLAAELIRRGQREVSVFAKHGPTGLLRKGRMDVVATDDAGLTTIADVKTTNDASPEEFARTIATWGYHRQAAYYIDLVGASFFVFIAVEKEPPYAVNVFALDEESIEIGRRDNEAALAKVAECTATGIWPAYGHEFNTISLPGWLKRPAESL